MHGRTKQGQNMHDRDATTDSGIYYIVPSKNGRSKKIIRRPRPPPTSAPLPDDFDAFTQGWTTARGAETERGTHPRNSWAPTSPPLDDDFDAVTYTAAPAAETVITELEPGDDLGMGGGAVDGDWMNMTEEFYGLDPTAMSGPEGEDGYGQYLNDTQSVFSRGKNIRVSERKGMQPPRSERTESPDERGMRRESRSALTNLKGKEKQNSSEDFVYEGRRRGPNFEVVENRVVEEGPDRTVTISTWRKRVAREAARDAAMSVFYVSADDYAADGGEAATRKILEPKRGSSSRRPPIVDGGRDKGKGRQSPWPPPGVPPDTPPKTPPGEKHSYHSDGRRYHGQKSKSSPTNPSHAPSRSSPLNEDTRRTKPHPHSHPSASTAMWGASTRSTPRTSMPVRGRDPLTSHSLSPARTSTPNRAHRVPSPFHPTRSMSTISSIRSSPKNSFKEILSSCEPSLLHVAPALMSLGIDTEEHLRALSRLTEETRDKEVKEEALRKGITVVEWAILLDKLSSLRNSNGI